MLAKLVSESPEGDGWVYERKLDGLRCIAVRSGDRVELWSRSKQIVALEGDRTSFALLQRPASTATPLLYAFDVLHLIAKRADATYRSGARRAG